MTTKQCSNFSEQKAASLQTSQANVEKSISKKLKSFSLNDLKEATKNFRRENLIGEGGFGRIFKGWIDENTYAPTKPGSGIVVAIKNLKQESFQGHKEWLVCVTRIINENSFFPTWLIGVAWYWLILHPFCWQAEVNYLGQLQHENLVKLTGYCLEGKNRLLVYEFMPKGSLENHLFRSKYISYYCIFGHIDFQLSLNCNLFIIIPYILFSISVEGVQPISWATRVNIAIGVARGLAFLHSLNANVIFRDLKASNILLDSVRNIKILVYGKCNDYISWFTCKFPFWKSSPIYI